MQPGSRGDTLTIFNFPEAKSKVTDWGIKSTRVHRVEVDSGIGLPIVNVLESILEWTMDIK
jgi:hypothetical protein